MCHSSNLKRMDLNLGQLPSEATAQEAVDLVAALSHQLSIELTPPSLRTLRLWRSKGWLCRVGRRFTRRNVLEALGIMRLAANGLAAGAAAQKCSVLDDDQLAALLLTDEDASSDGSKDYAKVTLDLLALGVTEQYRQVRREGIVGLVKHAGPQDETPPIALRQAMARLGRLYFEDGLEDKAASIHRLLQHCTTPLSNWAPSALLSLPSAADLVLIDQDYRVPSEDCEAIVERAPGSRMDDLIERRLHSTLISTVDKPGVDAGAVYSAIREFIARKPLVTEGELRELRYTPEIPDGVIEFVQSLYIPIHADHATSGLIDRCYNCSAPIDRNGRCFLQGCREDHPKVEKTRSVKLEDAKVARAEVLKYWVDPAREELRLYDTLRNQNIEAILYPHLDRCDVSIGEEVGVDVKDYQNPVSLARWLNRGVPSLRHYWGRRIVAIADRRVRNDKEYIPRLKERLLPSVRDDIEILSVGSTIKELGRICWES